MRNLLKQNKIIIFAAAVLILAASAVIFYLINQNPSETVSGNIETESGVPPAGNTASDETVTNAPALSGISLENGELTLVLGNNKVLISLCRDNILKIHYLPDGMTSEHTAVLSDRTWDEVSAEYELESNPAVVTTADMTVKIDKDTGSLSVYDPLGNVIISDFVIDSGKEGLIKNAVELQYEGDQTFYGISGYAAGDNSEGITRSWNTYIVKAGDQGYSGGPFVWTNSGYGLLVDSDGGNIKLDKNNHQIVYQNSSRIDKEAYLMIGSPSEIIGALTEVTGKAPMFPKWAMGFTNSQWGTNQGSVLDIIKTYREKNIPIDNFTLDFDWKAWGEDNYGEFRWNDGNFPDGASGKFAEMLADMGVKLTGILKPRIHVNTVQGDFITKNNWWLASKGFTTDYFSGLEVGDLDFSNPEVRKWYFEEVLEAWQTGFAGWWLDEADESSPNLQFLNMQRALYEGYRTVSNERVWSINRNFYVGAQKYAYGMWSGDINTGFLSMRKQRDRMLSAVNLGEAKWGMDTGGFHGTPSPENYARWMQFSALTPIFRVHGSQGELRQPWVYGETAQKAAVKAINLRYKLIPYIYSYEYRAYENGVGLVKPLVFDYPQDKNAENDVNAWMFGDYLLVSPVLSEGASSIDIYLPQGKWIDYEKGTVYEGGQTISYPVDSKTWQDIPMFLKEGAIIASQDIMNYVGEKPVDHIYLDIFPSASETQFDYYDDDGKTYDYENGVYFKQTVSQEEQDGNVTINLSKPEGSYTPETGYYIVKVHGQFGNAAAGSTEINSVSGEDELLSADGEYMYSGEDVYGAYTEIKIKAGEEKELILKK